MSAVRVVLQSELIANEELPTSGADPRAGSVPPAPLKSSCTKATTCARCSSTAPPISGLRVAVAMRHEVSGVESRDVV